MVGEVFRYAIQLGKCEHDPVGPTKGAIARPRVKHHFAILDAKMLSDLLKRINEYSVQNVQVGTALKLKALSCPRPGELRKADWSEFDLKHRIWNIPASRMKMRQDHLVPLPKQAVELLRKLRAFTGPNGFVFPATGRANRCMS